MAGRKEGERPLGQGGSSVPLVVVIAGPTAVGKSDAAMALAEQLPGPVELLSADSVQVYRGLDIGSNKPTAAEQARCPIHLIDWLEPTEACNVADWTCEALRIIDELHSRGVLPVVVGGSCLYIDWLVHGQPDAGKSDPELRSQVLAELQPFQDAMDWNGALALLAALAPEKAQKILRNNWRMLARQIEVARTPPLREGRASRDKYDMRGFFLNPPDRQALFQRIDGRCLAMLRSGLLEEVTGLLERKCLHRDSSAALAIGYRQVVEYLTRPDPQEADVAALCDFVRSFGSATRAYSRSQVQWFNKDLEFKWLPADPQNPSAVAAAVAQHCGLSREDFLAEAAQEAEARLETTPGENGAVPLFVSHLEQAEEFLDTELCGVLQVADACVQRVPPELRAALPSTELLNIEGGGRLPFGRVYWNGRHRVWGWGNPLGKVHRQGMQLFESCGWRLVKEADDTALPAFCWSTRKAADFPAHAADGTALPLVRPFPQDFTQRLDDKAQLAAHLTAAGHAEVHPPTWLAEDFLTEGLPVDEEQGREIWFLKHSRGVKGKAVHVFAGQGALRRRLEELGHRGCRGFVVQRGIAPPALCDGRKWVLRVHALLHGSARGELRAYCHRDMILVQHGQLYTGEPTVRAAHISSAGLPKHWPKPRLLEDGTLAAQVRDLTARAFASVWQHAPQGPYTPEGAELCQVFGLDVVVDAGGKAWLIEVNDFPAIGSGTMDHVDSTIYSDLVRDVLRLVVLPRCDGSEPDLGGFIPLDVAQLAASGPLARSLEAEPS